MGTFKQESATLLDASTSQRIESRIQEKISLGYTAPCGWLFHGLSFFFVSPLNQTNGEDDGATPLDLSVKLLQNTARFARANIATSLETPGVTHAILDSVVSAADVASLRKSVAALPGRKVPHLVTSKWVEDSWENGTLLDEERK